MPQSVTHLEGATDPCCILRYTASSALTLTAVHPILSPTGPRCDHRLALPAASSTASLTHNTTLSHIYSIMHGHVSPHLWRMRTTTFRHCIRNQPDGGYRPTTIASVTNRMVVTPAIASVTNRMMAPLHPYPIGWWL